MAQELWLSERQIPQMHQLGVQFVARSGMEEAASSGVFRGRPFGGVSIAWSGDLNHVISPLTNYKHKRVVAIEMTTADASILFITMYMPFFDSSNRDTCMVETIDALSMLDLIIHDHPQHLVVIGGDCNTELRGDSPFDSLWQDFSTKHQLAYCSQFRPYPVTHIITKL